MRNTTFQIGHKVLGSGHPVFIVAEISANHGQDLETALEMIRQAKACGADAVKFQTYTPDTMTIDANNAHFQIEHPKWGGQTLYRLYQGAYTPWEWFPQLKEECEKNDILFFSTAFDISSVDFLEELDVCVHKVASFELTDIPLIEHIAKTGKPVIMSTGMASDEEVQDAVTAARQSGVEQLLLLKCVSSYPASPSEMNLRTIPELQDKHQCCVGFSDHTMSDVAAIAAVTLGATFVEKHFILNKNIETPDSFFSIDPKDLKSLVDNIRTLEQGLGSKQNTVNQQEVASKNFRRSLFAVNDISAGEALTSENIRSIRPGVGLKPKHYSAILGKTAKQEIKRGTPLNWDLIQ